MTVLSTGHNFANSSILPSSSLMVAVERNYFRWKRTTAEEQFCPPFHLLAGNCLQRCLSTGCFEHQPQTLHLFFFFFFNKLCSWDTSLLSLGNIIDCECKGAFQTAFLANAEVLSDNPLQALSVSLSLQCGRAAPKRSRQPRSAVLPRLTPLQPLTSCRNLFKPLFHLWRLVYLKLDNTIYSTGYIRLNFAKCWKWMNKRT